MNHILSLLKNFQFYYSENSSLINVHFKLEYCDVNLKEKLTSILKTHSKKSSSPPDFIYRIICDIKLHSIIRTFLKDNINKSEDIVLAYCSKETGMIRAKKYTHDNVDIIYCEAHDSLFLCNYKSNTYTYIIANKERETGKILFKTFEHVLNKTLNNKGTILLHASSVEINQKGVLFVGAKRSGKTTALFDTIHHLKSTPVAFDKVHLEIKNNCITAHGLASRLRVLPGTMRKYGDTFDDLIDSEFLNMDANGLWKGESRSKIEIPLDRFLSFANSKTFTDKVQVSAIVIPSIKQYNRPFIKKLAEDEYLDLLTSQVFSPTNPEEDWWSNIGKNNIPYMEKNKEQLINIIKGSIPVYLLSGADNLTEQLNQFELML